MNDMNGDLHLRLKPFLKLELGENRDSEFWGILQGRLGQEALLGLENGGKLKYVFGPIENGEDDSAFMLGDGESFTIHLDSRMPFGMVVDFLLHELAHVHSWERADAEEDHCDEFGKSYAALYRMYLKLYDEYWDV